MNSGAVAGPVSWELQVARFLIPLLAAWTVVRALFTVFHDRWQQFLLRTWRDHIVICGLSRKGWLLARGFAAQGYRVVVIEADEEHDLIGPCRERGIAVLVGDATDPDLLRRAGVLRARHVVAVTDDDGVNAEIAVRTQGLLAAQAQDRRYPLTCTVHLVDPQLCELARTREMTMEERTPFRLELFNVFDHGARMLWEEYQPVAQEMGREKPPHVLVIGLGRLGESLVVYAAREWYTRLQRKAAYRRWPPAHYRHRPGSRVEVPGAQPALSAIAPGLRSGAPAYERALARVPGRGLPGWRR